MAECNIIMMMMMGIILSRTTTCKKCLESYKIVIKEWLTACNCYFCCGVVNGMNSFFLRVVQNRLKKLRAKVGRRQDEIFAMVEVKGGEMSSISFFHAFSCRLTRFMRIISALHPFTDLQVI